MCLVDLHNPTNFAFILTRVIRLQFEYDPFILYTNKWELKGNVFLYVFCRISAPEGQ